MSQIFRRYETFFDELLYLRRAKLFRAADVGEARLRSRACEQRARLLQCVAWTRGRSHIADQSLSSCSLICNHVGCTDDTANVRARHTCIGVSTTGVVFVAEILRRNFNKAIINDSRLRPTVKLSCVRQGLRPRNVSQREAAQRGAEAELQRFSCARLCAPSLSALPPAD